MVDFWLSVRDNGVINRDIIRRLMERKKMLRKFSVNLSACILVAGLIFASESVAGAASQSIRLNANNSAPENLGPQRGARSFVVDLSPDNTNGYQEELGVGACTGVFDDPKLAADGLIYYGLSVNCFGSGFLPLSARVELQEEHFGFYYQEVASEYRSLTEGGYGYVAGTAPCNPSTGHDYRIQGEIWAGEHFGYGFSGEVHLPCDV